MHRSLDVSEEDPRGLDTREGTPTAPIPGPHAVPQDPRSPAESRRANPPGDWQRGPHARPRRRRKAAKAGNFKDAAERRTASVQRPRQGPVPKQPRLARLPTSCAEPPAPALPSGPSPLPDQRAASGRGPRGPGPQPEAGEKPRRPAWGGKEREGAEVRHAKLGLWSLLVSPGSCSPSRSRFRRAGPHDHWERLAAAASPLLPRAQRRWGLSRQPLRRVRAATAARLRRRRGWRAPAQRDDADVVPPLLHCPPPEIGLPCPAEW